MKVNMVPGKAVLVDQRIPHDQFGTLYQGQWGAVERFQAQVFHDWICVLECSLWSLSRQRRGEERRD